MTNSAVFSVSDARQLVQDQLDRVSDFSGNKEAAAFVILVAVADLYVQLLDPDDKIELSHLALWPGLSENLEMSREDRILARLEKS